VIEVGRGSIFLHRKYVINKKIRKKEMAKITIDIPDYTIDKDKNGDTVYHIRETIGEFQRGYQNNPFDVKVNKNGDLFFSDPNNVESSFFIYADQAKVLAELNLFQRT
jgi:hypothetical protein